MNLAAYVASHPIGGFRLKVLVVDDNEEITSTLKRYLELEDFEVTISNDGRNGLNLIKNGNFDKILLDLAMPEFSGVDVLEELQGNFDVKQKVILFTASSISDEEIKELLAKGASTCIKKPIKMPELVQTLRTK